MRACQTHIQACPPPREVVREVGRQGREALILMAAVNLEGSNSLALLMDLVCGSTLFHSLSPHHTHTHTHRIHMCAGRRREGGKRRETTRLEACLSETGEEEVMSVSEVNPVGGVARQQR